MTETRDPVAAAVAALREGRPWEARDRLTGYLGNHADDLYALALLGDAEWHLQYPARAGRSWFLTDRIGPEVEEAVAAWRATGRAIDLARKLRVVDKPERFYSAAALARLGELATAVTAEGGNWTPGQPLSQRARSRVQQARSRLVTTVVVTGLLVVTVGVWLVGIAAVSGWLAH